jgi:hypothetical protein
VAIKIEMRKHQLAAALERAPQVIERNVDAALARGAQEVAREMKLALTTNRSMARSTLANSIRAARVAALHYFVAPGVNYSRMVEEGTGPAAGQKSYMPNPVHLRDYVKQRSRVTFTAKPRTPGRRAQMDEVRDRAWALAQHIKKHGTKPHPFVKPTRDKMEPRIHRLVAQAVTHSLQEVLGA